jgi:hypothetical protein
VVAGGGDALNALAVGNQETASAVSLGESRTLRALRKAAKATRKCVFRR